MSAPLSDDDRYQNAYRLWRYQLDGNDDLAVRHAAATAAGLPAPLAERLRGSDRDAIRADARNLAELIGVPDPYPKEAPMTSDNLDDITDPIELARAMQRGRPRNASTVHDFPGDAPTGPSTPTVTFTDGATLVTPAEPDEPRRVTAADAGIGVGGTEQLPMDPQSLYRRFTAKSNPLDPR